MAQHRRTTASKIQREAHLISRDAGDINALQTGGVSRYVKRRVRRSLTRRLFNLFGNGR